MASRYQKTRRFAGQAFDPTSALWMPNKEIVRTSSSDPMYIGRSESEWADASKDLVKVMGDKADRLSMEFVPKQDIVDELTEDFMNRGYAEADATAEAESVMKATYRGHQPESTAITYKTAHTAADEAVSQRALEMSGFNRVTPLNKLDAMATDFVATRPGEELYIDAQQRLRKGRDAGSLILGVLNNVNDPTGRFSAGIDRGATLQDLIARLKQTSTGLYGGQEDKLLHTLNSRHNVNPSTWLQDPQQYSLTRKDALITADRSQSPQSQMFKATGAYDRTPATNFDLVDLNVLRDNLLGQRLSALAEQGIIPNRAASRKGKFKLEIPEKILESTESDLGRLSEAVYAQLTR